MGYGVKAEFVFQKLDKDLNMFWESPVCPNEVLNSGLDRMGVGNWWSGISVGTSGAAVDVNQVTLINHHAYTSTEQGNFVVQYEATPVPRYRLTRRFRFNAGAFSGQNLAEVSISWQTSSPTTIHSWNRALIRDSVGNPTTITMLSDEYLDVICNVYFYPDLVERTSSVDLIDGSTSEVISTITTVTKPANLGKYNPPGQYASSWPYDNIMGQAGIPNQNGSIKFCTGAVGDITGEPTGSLGGTGYQSGHNSRQAYVPGSYQIVTKTTMGLNDVNGTIRSLKIDSLYGSYQISLDPPLVKQNTQVLSLPIVVKWGRYVAP